MIPIALGDRSHPPPPHTTLSFILLLPLLYNQATAHLALVAPPATGATQLPETHHTACHALVAW